MTTRALRALVNSSTNSQTGGKKPSTDDRRGLSFVLIAFLMTGCSKAVVIPPGEIESASREEHGNYRIQMADDSYYLVRRFTVTDSTVVIEKLNGADSRYRSTIVPIVVARSDVQSISKLETRHGASFAVVATVGVLVILIVAIATADFPETY